MRTETVEIDDRFGAEYKGKYVFGEITWARRNRIIQKHTRYHPVTGQVVRSDYIAIQAETIIASLKEQPESKPITLQKLLDEENGIPIELGKILSTVANRLNALTTEDLAFLLERLNEEQRTQLFQRFGYVKSSGGLPLNSGDSPQKPSKPS